MLDVPACSSNLPSGVKRCEAGGPANEIEAVDNKIRMALRAYDEDFWTARDAEKADSAHGLFQYPAMMVPRVQRALIGAVCDAAPRTRRMFDPFIGAGTSIAAAMYYGLDCHGQDINPLALLLAQTRTAPNESLYDDYAVQVVEKANSDNRREIDIDFPNITKWFRGGVAEDLSRLRRAICTVPSLFARRFLWVCLAETVRLTSNDRTSTYKLHARPLEEIRERLPKPIRVFEQIAQENLHSMHKFSEMLRSRGHLSDHGYSKRISLSLADARQSTEPSQFDLLVTSPPYGDNTTTVPYGQHSYLPLQWIELEDIAEGVDTSCLRTTQEIDRRSIGGRRLADRARIQRELSERSPTLGALLKALSNEPTDRQQRVLSFFDDLHMAFATSTNRTSRHGYLIVTVGDRTVGGQSVKNSKVIEEMLASHGVTTVETVGRRIWNKRMAFRNKSGQTMSCEDITVYRRT